MLEAKLKIVFVGVYVGWGGVKGWNMCGEVGVGGGGWMCVGR